MVCFTTYIVNLNDHHSVFILYLNWMKRNSLFYLFLVDFKVCKPKEKIRIVISEKYK